MQNAFRGSAHCGCGHSADANADAAPPLRLRPPATPLFVFAAATTNDISSSDSLFELTPQTDVLQSMP